jgi:hypothetical protein
MDIHNGSTVISNKAKGNAARLRAILAKFTLVGVTASISDDGTFTLDYRPPDEEDENQEEIDGSKGDGDAKTETSKVPSFEEKLIEEAQMMGFPMAFDRESIRQLESSDAIARGNLLYDRYGSNGFSGFLEQIAGALTTPLLVLALKWDEDPYSGAEAWMTTPASPKPLRIHTEVGQMMAMHLDIRASLLDD